MELRERLPEPLDRRRDVFVGHAHLFPRHGDSLVADRLDLGDDLDGGGEDEILSGDDLGALDARQRKDLEVLFLHHLGERLLHQVLRHLGLDRVAEHPLHHLHRCLSLAEPPDRNHPAKLRELLLDPAVHLFRRDFDRDLPFDAGNGVNAGFHRSAAPLFHSMMFDGNLVREEGLEPSRLPTGS